MNEYYFKINETLFIKIVNLCEKDHSYRLDEIEIFLIDNYKQLVLFKNDYLGNAIGAFHDLIVDALNNESDWNDNTDIGYQWNEYLHKEPPRGDWKGANYLLWEAISKFDTWLYNENNSIILEITPIYKWHFDDPEEDEEFIAYEDFMKTYKPIYKIEIPRETAKQWLVQTERLLKEIEKNDYLLNQK